MGILSGLLGGGVVKTASGVADVIDKFVETPDEKVAAAVLKKKIEQEPDKWQAEINKIEAAHPALFVSGWRPYIGWVCGAGLTYAWVLKPILNWILLIVVSITGTDIPALPSISITELLTILLALLGMSKLRSDEKKNGTARN